MRKNKNNEGFKGGRGVTVRQFVKNGSRFKALDEEGADGSNLNNDVDLNFYQV